MQLKEIPAIYDTATPCRLTAWVGVWAGLCAAIASIQSVSNDNIPNVLIPVSILRDGNVELSEFRPLMAAYDGTVCYWAVETPTGVYSRYPIWPGILTAPAFAPIAWWGPEDLSEDTLLRIGRFAAAACSGLLASLMVFALRRSMSAGWTLGLTFMMLLGSTVLHQIGSNLSNQTIPLLCIALVLVLMSGDSMSSRRAACIGLAAGLAIAARMPTAAIALAPLGVFLSRRAWRRFAPAAAIGLFAFPGVTLAYQYAAFGSAFRTGYGDEPGAGFTAPFLEGLTGLLISPSCGLFVYSPWLLFGALGAARCIAGRGRDARANELGVWITLGVVGQVLIFSKWWAWNGALSFGGARMLAETIPPLTMLIGLGGVLRFEKSRGARRGLAILGVLSIIHFAIGTSAFDVIARTNPAKPDWNIDADIVARFLSMRGIESLAALTGRTLGMLSLTFLAGGYMVARMLRSAPIEPIHDPIHRGA